MSITKHIIFSLRNKKMSDLGTSKLDLIYDIELLQNAAA